MAKKTKSTDRLELDAKTRDVFGKRLRKLRHQNVVPANIFGPDFKSHAITVDTVAFARVHKTAGETAVVYLKVEGKELPVMIRQVQRHPLGHQVLHIDFRKIDLAKKIETDVPVKTVGEAPAVAQKGGVLLTQSQSLLVEALPADIPHEIEVDLSKLVDIGAEIKVSDLPKSDKYEVREEPEKIVVSVIEHKEESLVAETAQVAPEITTEKPEEGVEGVEGEAAETAPAGAEPPAKTPEGKEKAPEKAPEPKKEEKKKE